MSWSDSSTDVREILRRIRNARIAVFGDFCVDAYWHLWEGEPEYSIETGLAIRRVNSQHNSLGGAGSVVANLREMGVDYVKTIGVAGADPFGEMLRDMLVRIGADTREFILDPSWATMVYAKPYLGSREEGRIDFGSFNVARADLVDELLARLEVAATQCKVVILNQQIPSGISSPVTISRINVLIARHPQTIFLVDSRHYQQHYVGASLKLNMSEAADLLRESKDQTHTENVAKDFARRINETTGKPTFLTRGEHGIVVAYDARAIVIPGLRVDQPVDTVGAGDAVVAALAAAMASGLNPLIASIFANIAAMITVKKIKTTGTASAAEIVAASESMQYTFPPNFIVSGAMEPVVGRNDGVARVIYED